MAVPFKNVLPAFQTAQVHAKIDSCIGEDAMKRISDNQWAAVLIRGSIYLQFFLNAAKKLFYSFAPTCSSMHQGLSTFGAPWIPELAREEEYFKSSTGIVEPHGHRHFYM